MTAWLMRPVTRGRYLIVWRGMAVLLAARAALGPYRQLADQPSALFRPVPFLSWLDGIPSAGVIAAIQVLAVAGAIVAVLRPRSRWALLTAWGGLLVLAGFKTSLGKILHNDLLLLFAAVPFLLAPAPDPDGDPSERDARFGLPVQTAAAVIALVYFVIGVQKLRHSGLAWVTGDNIRWVLYAGAASGNPPSPTPARFLADRAWMTHLVAAGTLAIELGFPLALVANRVAIAFAFGACAIHLATWVLLGLDYWAWALVVLLVFVDWDAIVRSRRAVAAGSPPRTRR